MDGFLPSFIGGTYLVAFNLPLAPIEPDPLLRQMSRLQVPQVTPKRLGVRQQGFVPDNGLGLPGQQGSRRGSTYSGLWRRFRRALASYELIEPDARLALICLPSRNGSRFAVFPPGDVKTTSALDEPIVGGIELGACH